MSKNITTIKNKNNEDVHYESCCDKNTPNCCESAMKCEGPGNVCICGKELPECLCRIPIVKKTVGSFNKYAEYRCRDTLQAPDMEGRCKDGKPPIAPYVARSDSDSATSCKWICESGETPVCANGQNEKCTNPNEAPMCYKDFKNGMFIMKPHNPNDPEKKPVPVPAMKKCKETFYNSKTLNDPYLGVYCFILVIALIFLLSIVYSYIKYGDRGHESIDSTILMLILIIASVLGIHREKTFNTQVIDYLRWKSLTGKM